MKKNLLIIVTLLFISLAADAQSIYKVGQQVGKDIVFNIVEDKYHKSLELHEVTTGGAQIHNCNHAPDGIPEHVFPKPDMKQVKAIAHSVFTEEEIAAMKESGERVFYVVEVSQVDGSTLGVSIVLNYDIYGSKTPQEFIFTLPVERFENLYTQLMQLKYKVPPYREWMTRPYTSMWPIEL